MIRLIRIFLILAYIAWVAGWLRVFGISFGPGFFRYHQGMRLIGLILSLLAIAVPPLSGYWAVTRTLRRKVGALKALAINLVISGLPVFMFWAVHAVWLKIAQRRGELAFEADEAMGIGIEYLLCLAAILVTNTIVLGIIVGWKLFKKKRKDA